MRVKPLVATVIAVALISCHYQRATLESVQIVEFGRFQKNMSEGSRLAPDAVAGKSSVVVAATLLESTTDIPATAGTSFGVRVKFVGAPAGLVVPCTAKCLHPKLTDPASGRSSKVEQWENFGTLGGDGYIGYSFDNEGPAHQVYLRPVRMARGLVTNAQWLDFIADGGYAMPSLWLSDGWATAEAEGWNAPGYWRKVDGVWLQFTLAGLKPVEPDAPVCHVSYYEAEAFARWAGKDLPSEAEWEVAARARLLDDAFGIVWQWTRSAYSAYPGFRAASGALGEYNGKFMINQMVLRGSSHATPMGHARASYRNFFYPPARWQFSGVRLADYTN